MAGVLSSIFDPGSDGQSVAHDSAATTVDGGTDLAVDQEVGMDVGVTYQDAEGGTHSWQMENDVGIDADVGATVSAILVSDQESATIDE